MLPAVTLPSDATVAVAPDAIVTLESTVTAPSAPTVVAFVAALSIVTLPTLTAPSLSTVAVAALSIVTWPTVTAPSASTLAAVADARLIVLLVPAAIAPVDSTFTAAFSADSETLPTFAPAAPAVTVPSDAIVTVPVTVCVLNVTALLSSTVAFAPFFSVTVPSVVASLPDVRSTAVSASVTVTAYVNLSLLSPATTTLPRSVAAAAASLALIVLSDLIAYVPASSGANVLRSTVLFAIEITTSYVCVHTEGFPPVIACTLPTFL